MKIQHPGLFCTELELPEADLRGSGCVCPEIPLFIEYKPSETRGTCFLDNASKTVLLIQQIGLPNLGVTLDFGHSMYGGDTTRLKICAYCMKVDCRTTLSHQLKMIAKWTGTTFAGSKHILMYAEFLYYLKKFKYNDYLTSDTSPTRWDNQGNVLRSTTG
jgi:xylose isomerase